MLCPLALCINIFLQIPELCQPLSFQTLPFLQSVCSLPLGLQIDMLDFPILFFISLITALVFVSFCLHGAFWVTAVNIPSILPIPSSSMSNLLFNLLWRLFKFNKGVFLFLED